MSQAGLIATLRGTDLIEEYHRRNAVRHAPYLLLFTMQGCESCDCLKEDLSLVEESGAFHAILCVTVSPDDDESCSLAGHYGLQDFPTAIVIWASQAVAGWTGHDRTIPTVERRAALAMIVKRALSRASSAGQVAE